MKKILCSTGAIIGKSTKDNFALLKRLSKELTCDGFEFLIEFHMYQAGYEDVEEQKCLLKECNLYIPVVHCDKTVGEYISVGGEEKMAEAYRLFEINCDFAKEIGAEKLVLHLWGGMASDGRIQNNIAAFHEEMELLYEKEYEWLWKDGHIRHYHVNDYAGDYMDWGKLSALPVGTGKLDFVRFFDLLKSTGFDGDITTEGVAFDENGNVEVELLNRQFAYIRERNA